MVVMGALIFGAILVGVLNALIGGGEWTFGWSDYHYDDSQYTVGDGTIFTRDLTEVSVDWIDGTVHIVVCQDDYPSVTESADENLTDGSRMRWYVSEDGRSLSIRYRKSSSFFGRSENKRKDLILRIPEKMMPQLTKIDVNVVSSQLTLEGVEVPSLTVKSKSGDVSILLPEDADFSLTSKMAGDRTPTIDFAVVQKDDVYVCGEGSAHINVEVGKGSVNVKKMK